MTPEQQEWIDERTSLIIEGEKLGEAAARALAESCWRAKFGVAIQAELFTSRWDS